MRSSLGEHPILLQSNIGSIPIGFLNIPSDFDQLPKLNALRR
jgi:hypothetical protein